MRNGNEWKLTFLVSPLDLEKKTLQVKRPCLEWNAVGKLGCVESTNGIEKQKFEFDLWTDFLASIICRYQCHHVGIVCTLVANYYIETGSRRAETQQHTIFLVKFQSKINVKSLIYHITKLRICKSSVRIIVGFCSETRNVDWAIKPYFAPHFLVFSLCATMHLLSCIKVSLKGVFIEVAFSQVLLPRS